MSIRHSTGHIVRTIATAAATAAGLAWMSVEIVGRVWSDSSSESFCDSRADYAFDAAFSIAGTMTGIALLSVFGLLGGRIRWLALAGGVGITASGYGNAVEHCVAEPFFLLFLGGAMAYVLTTTLLGIALLRNGELGRWSGVCLVVAALGLMLGFDRGGPAITGAGWLALAASIALVNNARVRAILVDSG
jgi:hypothetical protein